MDESTLVAHALRDYLRLHVDESELSVIDFPLSAGEPYSALTGGLGLAQHFRVSLPPVFTIHIKALPGLSARDRTFINAQLDSLPAWRELTSTVS